MTQDLFARADALQAAAYRLLDQLHYQALWEACGMKPFLVGSVKTGLMVEPNLDFNILSEDQKPDIEACFAVVQKLAVSTARYDGAFFFVNSHLTEEHPYLYINFGFKYAGEEWDFDNEIFSGTHPRVSNARQTTEALLQVMNAGLRQRILRVKYERLQTRGGSWRGSSEPGSLDIYRAVLEGGAETLADCEAWLVNHPGREDYYWLPPGMA